MRAIPPLAEGPPRPRPPWLRLLPIGVLAGIVAALWASGATGLLSLETLVRWRTELHLMVQQQFWTVMAAYVGLYMLVVVLSVPGTLLMTVSGGALFGWLAGGLAAVAGSTLGAIAIFLLVRDALGEFVRQHSGRRVNAVAAGFRADAFGYLLFLRLVPVFPFWLVNLAAALAHIHLSAFVSATLLGVLPATFTFAFVGAGLDGTIGAQERAYEACLQDGGEDCRVAFALTSVLSPGLVAGLTGLGLLALMAVGVRRWMRS